MDRPLQFSRRGMLSGATATVIVAGSASAQNDSSSIPSFPRTGDSLPQDRAFWEQVASHYDVDRTMANLENGYWGIMAKPVLAEYIRQTEKINQHNTAYARMKFAADADAVVSALARAAGVDKDEIAITRGATEAMQNLIVNYNRLQPGDSVLYADLDYDSMQFAMEWLKDRRGVGVFKIALPEPATKQAILDAYAKAISETPRLRLILLTHLSHRTGLVIPVKEIAAMARERNIDVILDAAHSWGQFEFEIADLGVDFIPWLSLYSQGTAGLNRPAFWRPQLRSERHSHARSYRNLELCCRPDASLCAEVSRGHRHTGQGRTSALSARSMGWQRPANCQTLRF